MQKSKWLAAASLVSCVAFAHSAAQAVVVTITASSTPANVGKVVFDASGFENDTVGGLPSSTSPAGSSWTGSAVSGGNIAVRSGATSGGPASAREGAQYLHLDRSSSGAIRNAAFSQDISTASESFRVDFAMWATENEATTALSPQNYFLLQPRSAGTSSPAFGSLLAGFGMRYTPNANGDPILMKSRIGGNSTSGYNVQYADIEGTTWTEGEWLDVQFAWDHTTQTASIAIDGGNPIDVSYRTQAGGTVTGTVPAVVGQFQIRPNNTDSILYIDAVPEPTTLGVIGLASTLLLRRRKA